MDFLSYGDDDSENENPEELNELKVDEKESLDRQCQKNPQDELERRWADSSENESDEGDNTLKKKCNTQKIQDSKLTPLISLVELLEKEIPPSFLNPNHEEEFQVAVTSTEKEMPKKSTPSVVSAEPMIATPATKDLELFAPTPPRPSQLRKKAEVPKEQVKRLKSEPSNKRKAAQQQAQAQGSTTVKERIKNQRLSGQSGIGSDFREWRSEDEMRMRQHYD